MIRRFSGRQLAWILTGLVALFSLASQAAAVAAAPAQSHPLGGITISPAFQQIVLEQGEPEKTFDFSLTNHTGETAEFSLSSVDFGSLDETGGVLFMGQGQQSLNYKYGLAQYVTLQQDHVVVDADATVKVPITIVNKESMSPGGHYGAILVSPVQDASAPSKVAVNEVMSSLLFVTKKGGEVYDMGLQSYQLKTHIFSMPDALDMRFQNAGNVHVIPRGLITVTDPRGKVVQQGFINAGSAIILPETFRRLSVPLKNVGTAWWPGVYHMKIAYRFDGEETDTVKSVAFTYINGWYVVGLMVLLAVIIVAILLRPVRRFFARIGRFLARPFSWLGRRLKRAPK